MVEIVGYLLTWTAYGSWLPGDRRGYVADGKTLPDHGWILEKNKERQTGATVSLSRREKEIVRSVITAEAERIGHKLEALSVSAKHVHIVVRAHGESVAALVSRYKSLTTRALWEHGRQGGYGRRVTTSGSASAREISRQGCSTS
jgi:hypothetical protein